MTLNWLWTRTDAGWTMTTSVQNDIKQERNGAKRESKSSFAFFDEMNLGQRSLGCPTLKLSYVLKEQRTLKIKRRQRYI